jgi:hypothetical protein
MLPPGHIAAGFLTAKAYIDIVHPNVTAHQSTALLWLGAFFGFAPDIDMFYAFSQVGALKIDNSKSEHRRFITHRPVVWLVAGLLIAIVGAARHDSFVISIGMLLWLCSWSHFILDSVANGIEWLWPFSNKLYGFDDIQIHPKLKRDTFMDYWVGFVRAHFAESQIVGSFEIALLITAILVLILRY